MDKRIINRNLAWFTLSVGITLIFSIPVSIQKKDALAKNVCEKLPYEFAYSKERRKYTLEEIVEGKIDYQNLMNRDLTSEEMGIYDDCLDVFSKVENKGFIRDTVFNVLQLWILMSVVSAYVLKYEKK